MESPFDPGQAIARMKRRNKRDVTWTLQDVTVRWRYIDGAHARNWDGSPAPNPGCTALERVVHREGSLPRYTNYW
jgi:hypothetical protein